MRSVNALALLAIVAVSAGAQIMMPRRPEPLMPQPLPKQPLIIQQQMEYQRLRYSFETYSMVNVVSGFAAGAYPAWASVGMGSRSEYRLTPKLAATMDATSSLFGGPARLATLELGTRYRPEVTSGRFSTFVDARAAYIYTYYSNFGGYSEFATQDNIANRFTTGVGALGGAGFEYGVSRAWTFTSALALTVSSMQQQRDNGDPRPPHFMMSTLRYSAGVRWNPVRMVSRDVQ
jgi:hypothetical protein